MPFNTMKTVSEFHSVSVEIWLSFMIHDHLTYSKVWNLDMVFDGKPLEVSKTSILIPNINLIFQKMNFLHEYEIKIITFDSKHNFPPN